MILTNLRVTLLALIPFCMSECSVKPNCFDNICLEENYCQDIRPKRQDGEAIIVDMKFEVDSLISVDTDLNIVGIQMTLTQTWMDNRVNASKNANSLVKKGKWLPAPRRLYKQPDNLPEIWTPTIWVYSMTGFEVKRNYEDQSYLALERITSSSKLQRRKLLKRHSKIDEHGSLLHYETQFDVYVKCDMSYTYFPFDENTCNIEITSADLDANILQFQTEPAANWHYGKELNKHKLRYFNAEILPLEAKNITFEDEPWSITGFKLQLKRRRSEYILNYMFPSALCVIVSWVTFVIPPEEVSGRVAILITMILVLVTIFNGVLEKTPRASSGSTAIIVWN